MRRWGAVVLSGTLITVVGGFVGCSKDEVQEVESPRYPPPDESNVLSGGEAKAERGTRPGAPMALDDLSADQITQLSADAYVYAYPLVLMGVTKDVMTATSAPNEKLLRAPANQLVHATNFPPATFKSVVRPNFDTLYLSAWMDLSNEPQVLTVPEMEDRYYLLQALDGWTDVFASLGTRTTGSGAHTFAFTGPNFKGQLPDGVIQVKAPSDDVWLIGRVQADGPSDVKQAALASEGITLQSLNSFTGESFRTIASSFDRSIDTTTPPPEQVRRMSPEEFFGRFAQLLEQNPAAKKDAPMLERLKPLQIMPGQGFSMARFDPEVRQAIARGMHDGYETIRKHADKHEATSGGWSVMGGAVGAYGTHYLDRATVAMDGLGANIPEDAVYPIATVDAQGRELDGSHDYVIRFDEPPPVKAFWSITLYDDQGHPVANKSRKYVVGSTHGVQRGQDGSIDVFVQKTAPGKADEMSNWLPAPNGPFTLLMRLYWPEESIQDGSWKPPAIRRVD